MCTVADRLEGGVAHHAVPDDEASFAEFGQRPGDVVPTPSLLLISADS
jgi:hypothetical protein